MSKAEEWRLIEDNPAMKIRVGNIPEFEAKPFTLEEARACLEGIKDDRLAGLYTLALGTGMGKVSASGCSGPAWTSTTRSSP